MHISSLALLIATVGLAQPTVAERSLALAPAGGPAPSCCTYADGVWECLGCGPATDASPWVSNPSKSLHGVIVRQAPSALAQGSPPASATGANPAANTAAAAPGPLTLYPPKTAGDTSKCGAVYIMDYNLPLHIVAVFVILVTSLVGVMFPIVAGWWSHRRGRGNNLQELDAASFGDGIGFWPSTFFLARHFGTGIIFSTTFIHLLDEGFAMFQDPCIGKLPFNATAPAIALAAAFLTFFLDFVGSRAAAKSASRSEQAHRDALSYNSSTSGDDLEGGCVGVKERSAGDHCPAPAAVVPVTATISAAAPAHDCSHADALFREQQAWQVLLLEAGIIFHSVMVGVTLGAGSGHGWTTLFIVIIFHQVFEGAALGARIAVLHWLSRFRALMYGMAFTLVTPFAMALGIGIRASFSQNGKAALLAVGVLDSTSAGILLYTAFKLLNSDFVEGPLRHASASRVALAIFMILLGCFLMSLLGKWA